MRVYVDSSALLKIYLDEPETDVAEEVLTGNRWVTGRHTLVEVRRNLHRALRGSELDTARSRFEGDWGEIDAVELGEAASELAAEIAERTGVRSLDALHLGAAGLAGAGEGLPIATFDSRLADAARSLGWTVLPE
ncbi:MAG: type II toxin-antitoxin system VapC family toxin [Gaiellaceae bacterium]